MAVLVAVAAGPMNRAEIQDQINADTLGRYIRKSKFYLIVYELIELGYMTGPNPCQLTELGWKLLQSDLNNLEHRVRVLKQRLRRY
jgi:hypothetical protein